MSNCGKLFVSVLNNRENKWCEENSILTDAQFGFRKDFSTTDAVFALHTLILHFMYMSVRFAYTYTTLYVYECSLCIHLYYTLCI